MSTFWIPHMKMNRRSFFRFFGRASGTAAAIVVGGAALLPAMTDATKLKRLGRRQADGSIITFAYHDDKLYEISRERDWKEWHAKQIYDPGWFGT